MVPLKAAVMVGALLTLCLLTSNTSAAYQGCCHGYKAIKPAFSQIKGYSVQSDLEMCTIKAIIFLTKKGKKFCADPSKDWVMDYINRLRTEAQIVHRNSLVKQ